MSGPIELTPLDLAMAAALILANAGVSLALDLRLGRRLALAAIRSVVQLSLLGWLLKYIFAANGPLPVIVLMLVMATLAGTEAVRRTSRRVRGMTLVSTAVMLCTSLLVAFYGVGFILEVDPWWKPQYIIPILGMILGNALNGVSLGLETTLEGFVKDRDIVESLLAHGATRQEASHDIVKRSVRTGTIPILNAMIAAGLISIPGMMTGQILAGEDPVSAAHYQMFILFSITGAVALGTIGVVKLTARLVFDDRDRLRIDRITQPNSSK
ncbi:MAG: putative ABC transport system permease protein [Planctomycetota bacterium]|jgi:putative ABC transport system permease protein